jgi:hypothetical protein
MRRNMTSNKMGKIQVDMSNEMIFDRYLKSLFNFCFTISDRISLTEPSNIGMTRIEYEKANHEKIIYQKQMGQFIEPEMTEEELILLYKEMANTDEEIERYIRLDRESAKSYDSRFMKTKDGVKRYTEDIFSKYKLTDRKVTCITPCTLGGAKVMYFFEIEDAIKHQFCEMEELFHPVIVDETTALLLDDPVFYKDNDIILSICSHERYATLYLTESQYEDFRSLEIPHITSTNSWWEKEEFPYKHSVNIGILEAGIISGLFGDTIDFYEVYGVDGVSNLYNQYKGTLEPNRITVSKILDKLNVKYKLKEYSSQTIKEQIMRNVYGTLYFSRQITSINDMDVHIYELEYENEHIIVGVDLSSNYICVDIPSVTEEIKKCYIRAYGFIDEINDKEPDNSNASEIKKNDDDMEIRQIEHAKLKHAPVLFTSCNRSRLTEKCCKILDEVTALRGLDEFELRNDRVVVNYLRVMGIN